MRKHFVTQSTSFKQEADVILYLGYHIWHFKFSEHGCPTRYRLCITLLGLQDVSFTP